MVEFMLGVVVTQSLIAALFFLRFWRETRERLFLIFALAFCVLAINRFIMVVQHGATEGHMVFYLVRFLAFALILGGIIGKNRSLLAS